MRVTKKQRAAKKQNIEESSSKETDSDIMEAESPMSGGKNNLEADFRAQTKVFLENLDQAYTKGVKEITVQYSKLKMKIKPEILELTLDEYVQLRNLLAKKSSGATTNRNQLTVPATGATETRVQSPNVTSSKTRNAFKPSVETEVLGSTFTTKGRSTDKNVTTSEMSDNNENQLSICKSIPAIHQNPRVVIPKFDPSKPVNPLRWANQSEMAISMKGSPLVVPGISRFQMINLNIPLRNGQVISILPKPMTNLNESLELNDEVLEQLTCIEQNISFVKRMCRLKQAPYKKRLKSITHPPSTPK